MKFSIITPTFNRAQTIERAIKSILNQNYQNFEMIIIDDGSTDNTHELVQKYLSDSRIKYLGGNKNAGVNVARNIGLRNISNDSDWVTFLDSDDEFFYGALENIEKTIKSNKLLHYFKFSGKYSTGKNSCNTRLDGLIVDYKTFLESILTIGDRTSVLNKKIIDEGFRFEESVNGFESLSWLQLLKKERVMFASRIVGKFHIDTESLTRVSNKDKKWYLNYEKGVSLQLKMFGDDLKRYNEKVYAQKLYALGKINIMLGDYKLGALNTYKAFKLNPLNGRVVRNVITFILPKIKD